MTIKKSTYVRPMGRRRPRTTSNINEIDFAKLKRKLRIMTNDRKIYEREVCNILRKQGHEIDTLGKENDNIQHTLAVAYGPGLLNKDITHAERLKKLLEAREDYESLTGLEATSCKELDVKIHSLKSQLNECRHHTSGEESENNKRIGKQRSITILENQVNKLTSNLSSLLNKNDQERSHIELLIKEKKIYQDLYNRVTDKISTYKNKIMDVTKAASTHYEQRLEALAKMKTLKERSGKDESMFLAEMKILQRMIAHDTKLKAFMNTKENERLAHKAEEAEKRAKMSVKEKALTEESQHVEKYEELFENVRNVTGHKDLEKVVSEFTAKDDENFARFDYVSELNHDVEKLRENIQSIKNNISRVKEEDEKMQTGSEDSINALKVTKEQLIALQTEEKLKLAKINDTLDAICGAVHLLFNRINCNGDAFKMTLAFEDKVTVENLKVYLNLIEQRCMELIRILKFIGLHQDSHENIIRRPRSVHRIRPRGPSKIFLEIVDKPALPSINTPSVSDDLLDGMNDLEDVSLPMDIAQLRSRATMKIDKKQAAGLLTQPLFVPEKRGKPKPKKNNNKANDD